MIIGGIITMTYTQIITLIWNMYVDHTYRQREIAEHLTVSVGDIGYILRLLGFHRCKLLQIRTADQILIDAHARFIVGKIKNMMENKNI